MGHLIHTDSASYHSHEDQKALNADKYNHDPSLIAIEPEK